MLASQGCLARLCPRLGFFGLSIALFLLLPLLETKVPWEKAHINSVPPGDRGACQVLSEGEMLGRGEDSAGKAKGEESSQSHSAPQAVGLWGRDCHQSWRWAEKQAASCHPVPGPVLT